MKKTGHSFAKSQYQEDDDLLLKEQVCVCVCVFVCVFEYLSFNSFIFAMPMFSES
jgi:hypothetical protein